MRNKRRENEPRFRKRTETKHGCSATRSFQFFLFHYFVWILVWSYPWTKASFRPRIPDTDILNPALICFPRLLHSPKEIYAGNPLKDTDERIFHNHRVNKQGFRWFSHKFHQTVLVLIASRTTLCLSTPESFVRSCETSLRAQKLHRAPNFQERKFSFSDDAPLEVCGGVQGPLGTVPLSETLFRILLSNKNSTGFRNYPNITTMPSL